MRKVLFICVVLAAWNAAVCVDPRESYQVLARLYNETPKSRVEFEFLQDEFITEIQRLDKAKDIAASGSQCPKQINEIIAASQNGSLWALKFLDSWGKFPSGIMYGHLFELGNFDECLNIEHSSESDRSTNLLQGQYCIANVPFSELFKNASQGLTEIAHIKFGICVPRSCEAAYTNDLVKLTLSRIFKVNITSDIVKQEKCIRAKRSDFETIDWIALSIFSLIGVLIAGCTIYDTVAKMTGNDNPNQLLLACSLAVNMGILFSTSSKSSPNVISCLNGIRCLTIVWIIFGHSYMMSILLPNINSIEITEWAQTPFSMFLQSGTISVDTFFFLSGLLLVWTVMKEMEKTGGKLNVLLMYVHRYIRLTPVVAATMLFFVSLYRHMGDGPLWEGFTATYKLCHENWWATLLYVQNYAAAGKMCVGHTWYLAVDMQLFVLSPLILIPIFKWKKRAIAGVVVLGLLLVACLFTAIVINNFSVFSTTGNLGADNQEMRKIYYATHARASPWIIGIIFGYFLYNGRNRRVKIRKAFVVIGWLISIGLLGTGLFALYPKTQPGATPLTTIEGAFYLSLSRVAWPLALSWIVFACVNGYGGFANKFLSWTFWQPMARLSYCMYIFHLIVETVHSGRTRVSLHFSNYDVILRFWGDFGITLLVSILVYLMIESPMVGIEKLIFAAKPKKSTCQPTVSKQNLCDNES